MSFEPTRRRRHPGAPVAAGIVGVCLALTACSSADTESDAEAGSEAAGAESETTAVATPSTETTLPADTEDAEEPDNDSESADADAEGTDADLVEVLLAAPLPTDVLGLESNPDLEPEVEEVDSHFLVCPVEDTPVINVQQTDFPAGWGTVVREFLVLGTSDEAVAYLDEVEAESGLGCSSELLRDDGGGRTSVVETFEPITVDGAEGFRSVITQEIIGRDGFSTVTRIQVQVGNVVVVATYFGGVLDDTPDLELLVQDGLELVRSAQ